MKIIHIIDSEGMYGAEVMLLNLAGEQKRSGHHPVIVSIREKDEIDTPLEDEARRRGLEAVTFRMVDGPNFLGAWDILRYARHNSFDVMHAHGYKGDILFGFIPRYFRKIPLICTLHGWTSMTKLSKLHAYEVIDALSMRNIDAVCVVNKAILSDRRLRHLKGRLHVIPNGIPSLVDPGTELEGRLIEFCRQGFAIVTIGRLSKEKAHKHLIEAFSHFSRVFADGRLLIIGEGPERSALEEIVKNKGLTGKVMLPGYQEQAWRYLRFCQLFVLSSVTEGMPITLLEALQTGVPVIATAVGGISEVLRHGDLGCLAIPDDPASLYVGMTEARNNMTSAIDMAKRAKEIAATDYSSKRMAEEYGIVYDSVIDSYNI